MKAQRGAALIVTLSMMAMAMMLGLSSVQSSLVDERLAGNYRALALAQMAAEFRASELLPESESASATTSCDDEEATSAATRSADWLSGSEWPSGVSDDSLSDQVVLGTRFVHCEHDLVVGGLTYVSDLYLVEGFVGDGDDPTASHFLRAGKANWVPEVLKGYLQSELGKNVILTTDLDNDGSASVAIDGAVKKDASTTPDPSGFISDVNNEVFPVASGSVIRQCDISLISQEDRDDPAKKYIYCDSGNVYWEVDDSFNGKVFVLGGGNEMQIKLMSSVNASFVADKDIEFEGLGGYKLLGVLWAKVEVRAKDNNSDEIEVDVEGAVIGERVRIDDGDILEMNIGPEVIWH